MPRLEFRTFLQLWLWFVAMNLGSAITIRGEEPAAAEGKKPKPVEIKAKWGPKLGPDGKLKSLPTAVIPERMTGMILQDFESRLGADLSKQARKQLLEAIKKRIAGDGPSAWFDRRLNKDEDDDVQISNPQTSTKFQMMGGKEQEFEIGTWQPPLASPAKSVRDGYQWKLEWMTQIGFGEVRRRYRIDVDLTARVDIQSADVTYDAVWKGPYVVEPVDFKDVRKKQEKPAKRTANKKP